MDLISKDFSPYDAPKDAIYEIKEMKMGNASIEEHFAKFKMLVTKSKLEKNEAVVEYFRETLPIPLQKNIMTLKKPPTTLNKWYKWAIKLQNNFVHMKSAIAKFQNQGGSAPPPTPNKKSNEKGLQRFYFDAGKKDPNGMDIDVMSMDKRSALMRKGACFICKETGHLAQDHKKLIEKGNYFPQKMKGKELHAHVRALLAQMEEDDKEEFFADAKKQGF